MGEPCAEQKARHLPHVWLGRKPPPLLVTLKGGSSLVFFLFLLLSGLGQDSPLVPFGSLLIG